MHTYAWQLTVLVYGWTGRCRVIQWTGTSTDVGPDTEQMTDSIYRDWLRTPAGRRYGPGTDVRLFAVRTDTPDQDVRQFDFRTTA